MTLNIDVLSVPLISAVKLPVFTPESGSLKVINILGVIVLIVEPFEGFVMDIVGRIFSGRIAKPSMIELETPRSAAVRI